MCFERKFLLRARREQSSFLCIVRGTLKFTSWAFGCKVILCVFFYYRRTKTKRSAHIPSHLLIPGDNRSETKGEEIEIYRNSQRVYDKASHSFYIISPLLALSSMWCHKVISLSLSPFPRPVHTKPENRSCKYLRERLFSILTTKVLSSARDLSL